MRIFISALIFTVVVCNSFVFAEEPPVERWVARYNGTGNDYDDAYDMAIDNCGNVYITGCSYGDIYTGYDYATIKYDSNGNQMWVARYNGPGSNFDGTWALTIDNSGNVYVTGESYNGSSSGSADYATIKYDSNGNQKWAVRYNGPGNGQDRACGITIDNSGNIYVTGYSTGSGSSYDYATIKYDSNGNQKWVARYNGPGNSYDQARSIAIDSFGNVYVTGISYSGLFPLSSDYATIKYDSNGSQKWVARYNGPGNSNDQAYSIAMDNFGNIYVTGESWGIGTYYDYATIKYDSNGNEKWVTRYNGAANEYDNAEAIAIDNSGSVYVTGKSASSTSRDYATIKYDSNGNEKWVACYDRPGNSDDSARNSIALDNRGNVYVAGESSGGGISYDYATIKYDSSGDEKWVALYNGPGNTDDGYSSIAVDNSGNVYVTGRSYGSGSGFDSATIKYTQHGVCLSEIEGDLNNDCKVDFADFAIIASHWLECKYAYEGDCL